MPTGKAGGAGKTLIFFRDSQYVSVLDIVTMKICKLLKVPIQHDPLSDQNLDVVLSGQTLEFRLLEQVTKTYSGVKGISVSEPALINMLKAFSQV